MYFDRQIFINCVLSVLGFLFVLVCIVCCLITIDHVIKTCRARRGRNGEEFAMNSMGRRNGGNACRMNTPLDANLVSIIIP